MQNCSPQTNKIKECLKRMRDCDEIIQEAVEAKKQKKEIEKELNQLKIDLVKDKKIERVNMSFEHWLEQTSYEHFYVYKCVGTYEYIVWKGEDYLSVEDYTHFSTFIKDYLVFNKPDYTMYNEMTETQHGFEDGDLSYHVHHRNDY